eukprot:scaffold325709_cov117-Tisochrysis_lutea.AAC.1
MGAQEATRLRSVRGSTVRLARCDAAEVSDVRRLVDGVRLGDGPLLSGVWHAAGVLSDGLLFSQTASSIRR